MESEKLLRMKKKIEDSKAEKSRLEGKKEQLENQLKTQFECETVDEAKKYLSVLEDQLEELQEQISGKEKEIEKKYEKLQE